MPKILCTLPNASDEISGVKFVTHANGMLSEDVSDDVAEVFLSIPGYELAGSAKPAAPVEDASAKAAAAEAEAKAAERAALVNKAEGLGLKVKGNWSIERLASEIQSVESAAKAEADTTGQPAEPPAAE